MFAIYSFCRPVDDIADDGGDRDERRDSWTQWRADLDALYAGRVRQRCARLAEPVRRYGLERADFDAVIDGMAMDVDEDIRAPDWETLDLYCDRVASAVGRLSVRVFGCRATPPRNCRKTLDCSRIISAARCNSPIFCAISTRTPSVGRLYLPREALLAAGITDFTAPRRLLAHPISPRPARQVAHAARKAFREAAAIMPRCPRASGESAAADGRRLSLILDRAVRARLRAAARKSPGCRSIKICWSLLRYGLSHERRHACRRRRPRRPGLRGAAGASRARASRFTRRRAWRAAAAAPISTRRSSWTIDNGNHLLLSGNRAARDYLRASAPATRSSGRSMRVRFRRSARWRALALAAQRLAPPLVDFRARAARARHEAGRLFWRCATAVRQARRDDRRDDGLLRAALRAALAPVLLSALNTDPREASATLAGAVLRETLAAGGAACRPMVARDGLGSAFIDPALKTLRERGVDIALRGAAARDRILGGSGRRPELWRGERRAWRGRQRWSWRFRPGARRSLCRVCRAERISGHSERPLQGFAARQFPAAARHGGRRSANGCSASTIGCR